MDTTYRTHMLDNETVVAPFQHCLFGSAHNQLLFREIPTGRIDSKGENTQ